MQESQKIDQKPGSVDEQIQKRNIKSQGNNANPNQEPQKRIQTDINFYRPKTMLSDSDFRAQSGFLQTLSSSTLMHSHPQFSFPKASRFQRIKLSSSSVDNLQMPSLISPKSATFGYGTKQIIPRYMLDNAKQIPAPNRYFFSDKEEKAKQKQKINSQIKGRTFGISYEYYSKTYWPNQSTICADLAKQNPSVGQYSIHKDIGSDKLKFSFYGRNYIKLPNQAPPCNLYKLNLKLVEPSKFSGITFGKGNKYDFTRNGVKTPGPGNYVIPSKFDKLTTNIKHKSYKNLIQKINKKHDENYQI